MNIKNMTLEEKIGQLIISRGTFRVSTMEMLKKGWLGGIGSVFIRGVCGLDNTKIVDFTNEIYNSTKYPLFFYTDCENGLPHMFLIGTEFPNNMALAATHDLELSYKMGKAIANEAYMMGYDIIAGPVLDINTNPKNPIIGTRAFADTREMVTEYAKKYVQGVDEEKVIACGKHFPGHGDTSVDSHVDVPIVDRCLKTLKKNEFYPFKSLVDSGIKSIMTSHTYFPEIQKDETVPVTFSKRAVEKLLLNSWEYNGLVITDSLSMEAISKKYSVEDIVVMSLNAGHDLLLQDFNTDPMITFNAILNAVNEGKILEADIDKKVEKIIKAKEFCNAKRDKRITVDTISKLAHYKEHIELAQEIADKSVTILENKCIPMDLKQETLIISTRNDECVEYLKDLAMIISPKAMALYETIKEFNENTAITTISENPKEEEKVRVLELCKKFKHVIITNFVRIISYKEGSGTLPIGQLDFIKRLAKQNKNVSTVIFGNPYVIAELPKTSNMIVTYSDSEASIKATADIMYGKKKSQGKLPVKINRKYDRGYGL